MITNPFRKPPGAPASTGGEYDFKPGNGMTAGADLGEIQADLLSRFGHYPDTDRYIVSQLLDGQIVVPDASASDDEVHEFVDQVRPVLHMAGSHVATDDQRRHYLDVVENTGDIMLDRAGFDMFDDEERRLHDKHADTIERESKALIDALSSNEKVWSSLRGVSENASWATLSNPKSITALNKVADHYAAYGVDVGRVRDAVNRVSEVSAKMDSEVLNLSQRKARAWADALGKFRETSPGITATEKSDKRISSLVNEIAPVFPREWMDKDSHAYIRHTQARGSWTSRQYVESYSMVDHEVEHKVGPWTRIHRDDPYSRLVNTANRSYTDLEYDDEGYLTSYKETQYNVKFVKDKPSGRGWEFHEEAGCWRRPRKRRVATGGQWTSVLAVSGSRGSNEEYKTAVHEMTHLAETNVPVLAQMQRLYIDERKAQVGAPDMRPTRLGGGYRSNEVAYDNLGFRSRYTGKVYPDRKNYEVLTTTYESLMAAENPGGKRASEDMQTARFAAGVALVG